MAHRADIGPKAQSLKRLANAGFPVPKARFLPTEAYEEHAANAGVSSLLDEGASSLDAVAVRGALVATAMTDGTATVLRGWHRELGGGVVAVRSSANAEDLPGASFAGQHGTYFARDTEQLLARVKDCWASLFSERAVRYREHRGIAHGDVAMGVIVQRVVPAVAAGVAFTADPVTRADDIRVESCHGIGETLVSGRCSPDWFVLDREGPTVRDSGAGMQEVRLVVGGAGYPIEEPVPEGTAPSISAKVAVEVAEYAIDAERLFGVPVDVEWAWDGDKVWLLQARPITTRAVPALAADAPREVAAPTIWSNVNTGEILPDVATPMTWSIIYGRADDIFGGMMGAFGVAIDAKRTIGLVGGRIYFNLTLLREAFGSLPGLDVDLVLGGMHDYVDIPDPEPLRVSRWERTVAVARAARAMPGYVLRHTPKKAARFAARMRVHTDAAMREIAAASDTAEAYRLVQWLNDDFTDFSDTLAFMAVAMFGYAMLGTVTGRWLDDRTGAVTTRLVAGQGGVASAEAGHAMWRLGALARESASVLSAVLVGSGWSDVRGRLEAAGREGDTDAAAFLVAWDAFMAEHGHHRRGELEFSNPSWAETPDYVLGIVRTYLADDRGSDPIAAYAERAADAGRTAEEILAKLGWPRRAIFKRVLGWGRASARTRENVKSEAVRWLVAIRHSLLMLGLRLVEGGVIERVDDIFFLEYGELEAAATGSGAEGLRVRIARRRAEYEHHLTLSPPPVVVGDWDESAAAWAVAATADTLKGIPVSSGVARGPARVFLTADTDEAVLPGEILVAPFTDPGWTPYFVPAAGIVMDMGGLLSHGSIIAREYGIPAVVNVGPATRIITTGQLIEVDGNTGEVRILEAR